MCEELITFLFISCCECEILLESENDISNEILSEKVRVSDLYLFLLNLFREFNLLLDYFVFFETHKNIIIKSLKGVKDND